MKYFFIMSYYRNHHLNYSYFSGRRKSIKLLATQGIALFLDNTFVTANQECQFDIKQSK